MKIFVDSANLDDIVKAQNWGIVDGVTTNPSLIAKTGILQKSQLYDHYKAICNLVKGPVSAEVLSVAYEDMVAEGRDLADIDKNIVVKVPMNQDGLRAIYQLSSLGIRTNCTLIFSSGQALLAAKAGATYVSPFVGRIDDIGFDGMYLIEQICQIYQNMKTNQTEVLAASIRNPLHIIKCAEIGVDVVTCPISTIEALFYHPLTNIGLDKFLADSLELRKRL